MDVTEARAHVAANWLTDTCTIRGRGEAPEFDPDTGYSEGEGDELYSGVCRLQASGGERVVGAGETVVSLHTFELWLTYDATGIEVDQLVTIDVSSDPHLVDRILRVVDVQGGTDSVYRKLLVEDTLDRAAPEEGGS